MLYFLPILLISAAPPAECTAPISVETPCAGALLPYPTLRRFMACSALLEAERELRTEDRKAADAKLQSARGELEVERERGKKCRTLLASCARPPPPKVEWWQGPEVVVSLLVVAVGALVAAVVLAVE